MTSQILPPLNLPTNAPGSPTPGGQDIALSGDVTGTTLASVVTMTGDVTGTVSNNTVAKLVGNPIQRSTYGSGQDGHVLTWVNTDGLLELKPSSGGGAGSNVFIYRDSDPNPSDNVFATWDTAYAAAIATGVPATIVIDDTIHRCSIPASSKNYDMNLITLAGYDPISDFPIFTIGNGVTWTMGQFFTIRDNLVILLEFTSLTSLAVLTANLDVFIENGASLFVDNFGVFFDASQSDVELTVHLGYQAEVGGNHANGQVIFAGNGNGDLAINIEGVEVFISDDAAGGTSGATLAINVNNLFGNYPTTWPQYTGNTPRYNYLLLAQNLKPYTSNSIPAGPPTNPWVQTGTMYYNTNGGQQGPYWWNGATWTPASGYQQEFAMVTLSTPQITGLTTGSRVLTNNLLVNSPTNNHLGYSQPGEFFMSFFTGSTNVAARLTANIGSLFDGNITYQWVDVTSFNGGGVLSSFSSPNVTITGMSNIPPTVVGQQITIVNADNSANNGTFLITSWISNTSVTYNNPAAITPDTGSGNLQYTVQCSIPLGNVSGNVGGGTPGDIVAIIPFNYNNGTDNSYFFQFQLTFVSSTTFIGENTAGGFILPWMTIETLGSPQ